MDIKELTVEVEKIKEEQQVVAEIDFEKVVKILRILFLDKE